MDLNFWVLQKEIYVLKSLEINIRFWRKINTYVRIGNERAKLNSIRYMKFLITKKPFLVSNCKVGNFLPLHFFKLSLCLQFYQRIWTKILHDSPAAQKHPSNISIKLFFWPSQNTYMNFKSVNRRNFSKNYKKNMY